MLWDLRVGLLGDEVGDPARQQQPLERVRGVVVVLHVLLEKMAMLKIHATQSIKPKPNYRAGHPICRKVLKIMLWEVPLADWLIL